MALMRTGLLMTSSLTSNLEEGRPHYLVRVLLVIFVGCCALALPEATLSH